MDFRDIRSDQLNLSFHVYSSKLVVQVQTLPLLPLQWSWLFASVSVITVQSWTCKYFWVCSYQETNLKKSEKILKKPLFFCVVETCFWDGPLFCLKRYFNWTNSQGSVINMTIHSGVESGKLNNSIVYLKTVEALQWNLRFNEIPKYTRWDQFCWEFLYFFFFLMNILLVWVHIVFFYSYVKLKMENYILSFVWKNDLIISITGKTFCVCVDTVSKRSYMHCKYDIY